MELSIQDIRDLIAPTQKGAGTHPFNVGDKVFIRTVTYHLTGRVAKLFDLGMTLDTAAWIADSGRFSDALKKSEFNEVEPFPGIVFVGFASITDATWITDLPTKQS